MAFAKIRYDRILDAHRVGTGTRFVMADADGNVDSSIVPRVRVAKAGTLVGTRSRINLIEGSNVTITAADDSGDDEIDVTIASSGGGSSEFVAPPTTGWSWLSTGHTVDTSGSVLSIKGTTTLLDSYVRTTASAPWDLHTTTRYLGIGSPSTASRGLTLRNSSSDKRYYFFIQGSGLWIQTYTGATFGATKYSATIGEGAINGITMFVDDNNTNLVFYIGMSTLKAKATQVFSEARGTWAIPDQYGVLLSNPASTTSMFDTLSWEVT